MALQYSRDQLIKLRESPLVVKPTSLPPAEEWMGQPPDPNQKRTDTNVRNPRVDNQSRPPGKTPFAAVKASSGSFDIAGRSAFGNFASDIARVDYLSRSKLGGEQDKPEESLGRYGKGSQQRRGEGEGWSGGLAEAEKSFRRGANREGDAEQIGARDSRRRDTRGRDEDQDVGDNRKNGASRSDRTSWLRGDGVEPQSQDSAGQRGWRASEKGSRNLHDRDWSRGGQPDTEPEWMMSGSVQEEEDNRAFGAQDIEQWKASMRAREKDSIPGDISDASAQHSRTTSNTAAGKHKNGAPLMVDSSLDDKFFSFFSGAGNSSTKMAGSSDGPTALGPRGPAAKSKFSGFFNPQVAGTSTTIPPTMSPPTMHNQPPPSLPPPADSASEDKAGFQRILAMLAGPQATAGVAQPVLQHARHTPPAESVALHSSKSPPPILSPRSRRPGGLENLLSMQSPPTAHAQPTNKDADFLLNLLRSKDGDGQYGANPLPTAPQRGPSASGRRSTGPFDEFGGGLPGQHEHMPQHPGHPQHHPRSYADEGDEQHRPYLPHFHGGGMPPLPPGLQRPPPGMEHMPHPPPGMEHMPPPPPGLSYIPPQNQPQQQRSPLGAVGPPPGFSGRLTHAGQFPPGLVGAMGSLNLGGGERGGPFGPMGPGPGMRIPPPPGFGGMGAPPPPGFPPLGGLPDGFAGPPPQNRIPMDLFDGLFGGGVSGRGMPPPGHSRRQE